MKGEAQAKLGVAAAVLSSAIGGTTITITRFVVNALDPAAIGAFRFTIGFMLLVPIAIAAHERWPPIRDWPATFALGILYFVVFPLLFNWSVVYTTSARAALALSTTPLLTMIVAAALRAEALSLRKTLGVVITMAGVFIALLSGLSEAPRGAWKGELLMIAAALCLSLYNVWSQPLLRRSAPIPYANVGMAIGGAGLLLIATAFDAFQPVATFDVPQWLAILYLGVCGGAVLFWLWAFALARATATQVAMSVTINPIVASIGGAFLLGEQISLNVVVGLLAVFAGIWIATATNKQKPGGRMAAAGP
jgi:drug/metabolite transporter (DMT)-like permease